LRSQALSIGSQYRHFKIIALRSAFAVATLPSGMKIKQEPIKHSENGLALRILASTGLISNHSKKTASSAPRHIGVVAGDYLFILTPSPAFVLFHFRFVQNAAFFR
jgi:hypothetical protein